MIPSDKIHDLARIKVPQYLDDDDSCSSLFVENVRRLSSADSDEDSLFPTPRRRPTGAYERRKKQMKKKLKQHWTNLLSNVIINNKEEDDEHTSSTTSSTILQQTTGPASSSSSPTRSYPQGFKLERTRGYTRMHVPTLSIRVTPTQVPALLTPWNLPDDPSGKAQSLASGSMPVQQAKQEPTTMIIVNDNINNINNINTKTGEQQQQPPQVHQPPQEQPGSTRKILIQIPSSRSVRNIPAFCRCRKEQRDPSGRVLSGSGITTNTNTDMMNKNDRILPASRASEFLEEGDSDSNEEEESSTMLLQEEQEDDTGGVYITCNDRRCVSEITLDSAFGGGYLSSYDSCNSSEYTLLTVSGDGTVQEVEEVAVVASTSSTSPSDDIHNKAPRNHLYSFQSYNSELSQFTEETVTVETSPSEDEEEDSGERGAAVGSRGTTTTPALSDFEKQQLISSWLEAMSGQEHRVFERFKAKKMGGL